MCRRSVQALLDAQRILCGFKNIFSLKMIGQLFTVRSPGNYDNKRNQFTSRHPQCIFDFDALNFKSITYRAIRVLLDYRKSELIFKTKLWRNIGKINSCMDISKNNRYLHKRFPSSFSSDFPLWFKALPKWSCLQQWRQQHSRVPLSV